MALRIDQRDIGAVKVLDLAGKLAGDAADALWDGSTISSTPATRS